jgi:hypothetical protein
MSHCFTRLTAPYCNEQCCQTIAFDRKRLKMINYEKHRNHFIENIVNNLLYTFFFIKAQQTRRSRFVLFLYRTLCFKQQKTSFEGRMPQGHFNAQKVSLLRQTCIDVYDIFLNVYFLFLCFSR